MPVQQTNYPQVPTFGVRINGADVSEEIAADMISTTVYDDVDAPSMFTVRLVNWDMTKRAVSWADDKRFTEGGKIEVQMGYVDQMTTLISGEITGLEPEFAIDEIPQLMVRGYDRRHRLMRGRQTRTFTKMKDSDIAKQIIASHGLSVQVKDSELTLEYVLQHNQTDMEFLQERAARISFEIACKDEEILFRPRQHSAPAAFTLDLANDLIEFAPRLTTLSQVSKVVVRSWNPKDKAVIVAQAAAGSESTTMSGKTSGPSASNTAFGQSTAASVMQPMQTKAEADKFAKGQLNNLALAYISGDGVCNGRNDLRAGIVIRIDGIGNRFSGNYYVTSTRHSYSTEHGYRTAFSVRRNAT